MGGGLAMSAAAYSGDFAAAVAFYGNPLDEKDIPRLQAPLLGMYGENDPSIPPDKVQAFDEMLDTYHLPHEIVTYPGAGHAFFNDARPDHYHEDSARDAWNRTLAWLRMHLG
jgi:carboxymethylenebutenolidase